jgi:hypothetical protein
LDQHDRRQGIADAVHLLRRLAGSCFRAFVLFSGTYGWRSLHRLWGCVRLKFCQKIGRTFVWPTLMVLVQIMIIFMQRVFAVSELSIGRTL